MSLTTPLKSRAIAMSPVYYGWVVLAAGTVGMIMTLPGQTAVVSVFIDPIMADLDVSRPEIATLYGAASLLSALALPVFGRWLDQRGPRIGVTVVACLFGLACIGMGLVTGPLTLLLAFVAVRSLGQGALGLVSQHAINQWFVRRRGLALGVMGVGFAAASAVVPMAVQALVASYNWRIAYMALGVLLLVIMVPVGAGLYRPRPELYGLLPDGAVGANEAAEPVAETNMTRAEAIRTATFWLFACGTIMMGGLATALIFHHFSLMALQGIPRGVAAGFFLPLGIITAASNMVGGLLLDRTSPRWVLLAAQAALFGALALAMVVEAGPLMMAYGTCLGAAMGLSSALTATVWAHYFGRRHLGSIKGLVHSLAIAGTAIVPLPFAFVCDYWGTYHPALLASLLFPLALAIAIWRLPASPLGLKS